MIKCQLLLIVLLILWLWMWKLALSHATDRLSIVVRRSVAFAVILEPKDDSNASQYGTKCCDQACRHDTQRWLKRCPDLSRSQSPRDVGFAYHSRHVNQSGNCCNHCTSGIWSVSKTSRKSRRLRVLTACLKPRSPSHPASLSKTSVANRPSESAGARLPSRGLRYRYR